MFLRSLTLHNYSIFKHVELGLAVDSDRPIVLITGNNGAGKTSILEALRLGLHGKRAFDTPLSDVEYQQILLDRFHQGNTSDDCYIRLVFEFVDDFKIRKIELKRLWTIKRDIPVESLTVLRDGLLLPHEDADDLLTTIVPPEIARYFFFDGERISDLADWDTEDSSNLFDAVSDLLGLSILEQLKVDLARMDAPKTKSTRRNAVDPIDTTAAEQDLTQMQISLRAARQIGRKLRADLERARADIRRVGVLKNDEFRLLDHELSELTAERRLLNDEAQRAAADVLPLLCAKSLRSKFALEANNRRQLEDREILYQFLRKNSNEILRGLYADGIKGRIAETVLSSIEKVAMAGLVPVATSLPNLSRADSNWMERVIDQELPQMAVRVHELRMRLNAVDDRLRVLSERRRSTPLDDPAGELVLQQFERANRSVIENEAAIETLVAKLETLQSQIDNAREEQRIRRLESFRNGRGSIREVLMEKVLLALPALSEQLQQSKEQRFADLLLKGLAMLWQKPDRVTRVEVSFKQKKIELYDDIGLIKKRELSAGEKQLFAVAFIYSLAKLSGRLMPFVIDTPLGRLDKEHRRRFVAEFLPNASHQVIVLSTDTEIVGNLYEDVQSLIAQQYELSDFNGERTVPVEVRIA